MRLFDKSISGKEFNQPQLLSKFFDILLHLNDYIAGKVVIQSVEFLSQLHSLLQELLIHQFFKLSEVVLQQRTIESLLLFEIEFHSRVPNLKVRQETALNCIKDLIGGDSLFEHFLSMIE